MMRERTGCLIQQPTNGSEDYKKQAYLKGVAGVRELRVRYRKTARKRLTQLYLHSLFGLIYFLILSMTDSYGCTGRILQPS
jgi:hypothetical protein